MCRSLRGRLALRVDQRVGGIGDEQNLAAGEERFAHRASSAASRATISASSAAAARFGQPIAASALEAAPSIGNSDGAGRRAAGRRRIRGMCAKGPAACRRAPRVRAERSAIASHGARRSGAIVIGSEPIAASPLCTGEAPGEPRARRRLGRAREPHRNVDPLAGANRRARRRCDDEPRPLKIRQPFGEGARAVANVHEAVRFPLRVVELGDDIAGDRPLPAQRLDLVFQRAILELLRRARRSRRDRRRSAQAPRRESASRCPCG